MTRELTKKQLKEISEDDLGRRLLAALMSYRLGRTGVDYTLHREGRGLPKGTARAFGRLGMRLIARLIDREASKAPDEGEFAKVKTLSKRVQ